MTRWISIIDLFGSLFRNLKLFFAVLGIQLIPLEIHALAAPPYIVVLDPGHGGSDTGAQGIVSKPDKNKKSKPLFEKDISLAIATRVGRVLNDPQYWMPLGRKVNVIFTRKKDSEVSLEARAKLAHENKADLFVSIHCNSETTSTVRGVESYFLNNTDDASSKKLAEIENKFTKKYANVKPEDLILRSVAVDAMVEASKQAANLVHLSLLQHLERSDAPLKSRGVKQALLYVLLDSQTPAVLLEPAFLSNKQDALFLSQAENRQKIAEGIAIGILRFLALR